MKTHLALTLVLFMIGGAHAENQRLNETRQRNDFPMVNGSQVLCADFHMHTTESDGIVTPEDRVLEAYRLGYDIIALADHQHLSPFSRTIETYKATRALADSLGIVMVFGLETGLNMKEHLVVLGVSEDFVPRDSHEWADNPGEQKVFYQDQLREMIKAGGIAIYAHPHLGLRDPIKWGIENGAIVAVEVENQMVGRAWGTVKSHGTWFYPFAMDWALENNLAVVAGSDYHGPRITDVNVFTLVFAKDRTPEAVMEAIRSRKTLAWFDDMIWGPEELMSDMLKAIVIVRQTNATGGRYVRIRNDSPIPLSGEIDADTSFEVAPYGETLVELASPVRPLVVKWTNAWVSSKENCKVTYE